MSRFQTTQWSLILSARGRATTESRRALSQLCEAYWGPLYAYVRRQGYDVDDACDLTQGYFCALLERDYLSDVDPGSGRFRWFLLASLKHYLSKERDRVRAKKRGGGKRHVPFDAGLAERLFREAMSDQPSAETLYERRWAHTLLARTKERLSREFESQGTQRRFQVLKGHLTGDSVRTPVRDAGRALEMNEGAVRVAIHRMRSRFGELLRDEVAQTTGDASHLDDELRHLLTVVSEEARGGES